MRPETVTYKGITYEYRFECETQVPARIHNSRYVFFCTLYEMYFDEETNTVRWGNGPRDDCQNYTEFRDRPIVKALMNTKTNFAFDSGLMYIHARGMIWIFHPTSNEVKTKPALPPLMNFGSKHKFIVQQYTRDHVVYEQLGNTIYLHLKKQQPQLITLSRNVVLLMFIVDSFKSFILLAYFKTMKRVVFCTGFIANTAHTHKVLNFMGCYYMPTEHTHYAIAYDSIRAIASDGKLGNTIGCEKVDRGPGKVRLDMMESLFD